MSYAFNDDKSRFELDVVFSDINLNINGKADERHTHSADDITDGTLAVARIPNMSTDKMTSGTLPESRGGTGQTTLQAARNAMGLGNTTGALPVANGGTGANSATNARANLAAVGKRNLSANYAGSTANSPDFLIKSFTDSGIPSSSHTRSISIGVSGYLPIAIASARVKDHLNNTYMEFGSSLSNTAVTLYFDSSVGYTVDSTIQVLYVRTAMINQ